MKACGERLWCLFEILKVAKVAKVAERPRKHTLANAKHCLLWKPRNMGAPQYECYANLAEGLSR